LTQDLRPAGNFHRAPLGQILFALQKFKLLAELETDIEESAGVPSTRRSMWQAYVVPQQSGQFDLCLELAEGEEGFHGYFEYKPRLFERDTIDRLGRHFVAALSGLVSSLSRPIGALSLIEQSERRRIVDEWSGHGVPSIALPSVQDMIREQASRRPDKAAVLAGERCLTYRELERRANQLAHYLRRRGVGPGIVVGLCLDRCLDMIVGLLGILKAGGAYLPLDADYPIQRLDYMLADSRVRVIVTQQKQLCRLPASNPHTICLDSEWDVIERCPDHLVSGTATDSDLAYVIYTSGSTGQPKGVMVERQALSNYVSAISGSVGMTPEDRVLQFASLSFDTAAEEIFPCLAAGATLVLRHSTMVDSISGFFEACAMAGITVLDLPTAYWHEVVSRMDLERLSWPRCVRQVIIGGERALPHIVERWNQVVGGPVRLLNTYGPTEATIAATMCDLTGLGVDRPLVGDVPIGRPIPGVVVYVLDQQGGPVPIGVPGELYIGGVGLARGYWGRAENTAAKFVRNPFNPKADTRLYRTGDLVRWRRDGLLEYRGRADRQVKMRGYRIELEEIEALLNRQPEISQAVVEVREDQPGDKRIAAFLVPRPDARLGVAQLRERLKSHLPAYMIPSSFTELGALPRTANGKVDRQALRVAMDSRASKVELTAAYVPPRTVTEQMLAHVWGEILHVKDIGVHDNFFELGGHSLLATQLVSRLQSLFQVRLPLRRVFETPTVATLAEIIEAETGRIRPIRDDSAAVISRVPRGAPLPLSFAQERMWFLYQLAPAAAAYNIPASIRLQGPLNKIALRWAIREVVKRHEALRTTFVKVDGQPRQVIHDFLEPLWNEDDLRLLSHDARETRALESAMTEARRPFDLANGPLIRVLLIAMGEEDHLLMVTTHHIISDQWSYGIIARELVAGYNAGCLGKPALLSPELPVQYVDFAQWQREWLAGPVQMEQLAYWKSKLADLPAMSLPGDRPRPPVHSFKGDHVSIDLPWTLITRLKQLSVREGATLYMVFLAGFFSLLYRLTQQRDLVIGTPIANRHWLAIEDIVGTFVNTLVLRAEVSEEMTFRELLGKIRELSLEAYAHQDIPFEKLVEELRPDRSHGGPPLVQVLFNFANTPFARTEFLHLSWTPYEVSRGAAQLDLGLSIDPLASRKAYLEFNSDLFDRSTVERWLLHYQQVMEAIAQDPQVGIGRLAILTDRQRRQVVTDWNATQSVYSHDRTFPQLFEEQAARSPDAPALIHEGQELSYAELNRRANRVASWLRELGVGPDVVVPVCLERSIDLLVALLGVMKAGGAYLPLVPGLPPRRLATMLESSQSLVLITDSTLEASLPRHQLRVVRLDRDARIIGKQPHADLDATAGPQHLCYVLFTSGSTGQPKAVEIEHRALLNFLESMQREPGLTSRDALLAITPLSFDIAGLELYLPLLVGARIVLATRRQASDGGWLAQHLDRGEVTIMQATPATWRMVIASGWKGGRGIKVLCGGEAMPRELAQALLARAGTVWNVYGPTETTIWSTVERVRSADRTVPIGRPIANTQVYVLDPRREPVPIGISGELYIGGAGLARGYRGAPALTRERFVASPFRKDERLYRTGDQVKWLADGRLDYVGRMDYQVKLRGFRIELGEIEAVLSQDSCVKQAVAVVREDVPGDKRLVTYVTAQEGQTCDAQQLRRWLRDVVPDYMVPSAIVVLKEFPLTPNGKVDRAALPAPDFDHHSVDSQAVSPRNPIELQLAAIWEQVLGVTRIGVKDNFFELGGYSLLALRLFSAIERAFGKRLPMALLFQAPTIEQLADLLADEGCTVRWRSLVAIQPEGTKTPFFAVPGVGGNVLIFARLAKLLGEDRPFYGLQARGLDGKEKPFMRIEDMAAHYIAEIRSVQPEGPYLIGGTCTGGLVAYEMGQQLAAEGQRVILSIMQSWHPRSYVAHWSRPPYVLWPLQFVLRKVASYLHVMRGLPIEQWPKFWRGKLKQVWSSMHQAEAAEHQDEFLYKDQVTYATFHAAARYSLKPFPGPLLNVIASKHPLTNSADDTRLVFGSSALGRSQTIYVPAEDSGRLFVAPHVHELALSLQRFWTEVADDFQPQTPDQDSGPARRAA
jgi:amino acid adenylation domain-containing protein